MRRIYYLSSILILAACGGGQSVSEPCVMRLNIEDRASNVPINTTITLRTTIDERDGNCATADRRVTWESTRANVLEIVTSTDSTATARARSAGSVFIKAWLTRTPEERDSIGLNVIVPTE